MNQTDLLSVFIADDSELLQELLRAHLEELGCVSVAGQAGTGRAAIAGVLAARPDVLLLDLNMPDGDGFAVLDALGTLAEGPLVIIMTFEAEKFIRSRCRAQGAHLFFDKTGDPQVILSLFESIASGRKTIEALKQSREDSVA